MKTNIAGALVIMATATLSGLMSYGTYGYLKDKKKWSSWKAGAATGLIGGALASIAMLVSGKKLATGNPLVKFPSTSQQLGVLVLNRLSGCPGC